MAKIAIPILLAVVAGMSVVVQQVLNANLKGALNSAAWAGFASYIVGTLCMAIATLGSGPLPRVWKGLAWALLLAALVSWPIRAAGPSVEHAGYALPPHEGLHGDQVGVRGDRYRWSKGYAVMYPDLAGAQRPARARRGGGRVDVRDALSLPYVGSSPFFEAYW